MHPMPIHAAALGIAACLMLATAAGGAEAAPPRGTVAAAKPPAIASLERYAALRLEVPAGTPERCEIGIVLDGAATSLRLHRVSLRDPKARLLLDRGNGVLEEAPLPPHRTYRGIDLATGASVAASIVDGRLWAMIDRPDATWFIQPASDLIAGRPAAEHVAYRHADVVPIDGHRCGNDLVDLAQPDWMRGLPNDPAESGGMRGEPGGTDGGEGGVAGTNPYVAEIAFDADYEFFQKNGLSAAGTVNDIENVMNAASLVYDRDVNVSYEFTTFVVRTTTADPYTTNVMADLLCEFRNAWNATPESQIQRDLAQLFTGKSISGSVIGLAWLGAVCNQVGTTCAATGSLAYSAVESRFTTNFDLRVSLSSHEIGHNWSAQHCDAVNPCHIMCATINQCQGTTGTNLKFGASEQTQIVNYRNAMACDVALPSPIALPFAEGFDGSIAINAQRWTYAKGAAVSTAALGEPSPTRSLNLDAIGNLEYGDDEIRSNFMLLAGLPSVTLSYATEHRGVEAGKSLVVEYLNSSLDWIALNTIVSDGVDQSAFATWQHVLPAGAKHDRFRIRFRTLVDGADDDWFVDDVSVVDSSLPPNDECASATTITVGAVPFDTTAATDSATTLPASCDIGNGVQPRKDLWYFIEAPCTGRMTASTCGSAGFDTYLAAYGLTCPTLGFLLACNDDGSGCGSGTSSMSFDVAIGQGVLLRVGGVAGGGTGTLHVSCVETPPCPTDLSEDGTTDAADLAALLGAWGTPAGDVDGDGDTDAADLSALLGAWGACE